MKKLFTLLFVLIALNFSAFGQAVGDYGTSGTGNAGSTSGYSWQVCQSAGTWTGATTTTALPTSSTNIWVLLGHNITLTGVISCKDLNIVGIVQGKGFVITASGNVTVSGTSAQLTFSSNGGYLNGAVGKIFTLSDGATFGTSMINTTDVFSVAITNMTISIVNTPNPTFINIKGNANIGIKNPRNSQSYGNLTLSTTSGGNGIYTFGENINMEGNLVFASSSAGAASVTWDLSSYYIKTTGSSKTVTVTQAATPTPVIIKCTNAESFQGFSSYSFSPASNASCTVNYAGTSQTIAGGAYQHLTVAAGTKTLSANTTVSGTLTLGAGIINTSTNSLALKSTGTLSRTSGYVIGNLTKNVALGSSVSRTYELGEGTNYLPVTVAFGSVTIAGDLTVKTTAGSHANIATSGINSSKSVSRYWTLSNSGIVFTSYSSTFTFVAGDILGSASPSLFVGQSYNGSSWSPIYTMGTLTSTTSLVTGVTSFGDFILGETAAATPSIGVSASTLNFGYTVSGGTSAEQSYTITGSNLTSNVTVTPPTGFEISTGTGGGFVATNPITIVPSSGSVSQSIYVRFVPASAAVFSDNITNVSSPVSANVLVTGSSTLAEEPTVASSAITFSNPSPTSITVGWTNGNGANKIVIVRAGSAPSANPSDGNTYTASATFASGSALGSGYVVYNSTGSSVTVTGLTANTYYYVNVYELNGSSGTENYLTSSFAASSRMTGIAAKLTGNWSSVGTWQGGALPTPSDNVIIPSTYTVTADGSTQSCLNLTVESGGTLKSNGSLSSFKTLAIYGSNVINNGAIGLVDAVTPANDGTDGLILSFNNSTGTTTFSGSGTSNLGKIVPGAVVPELKFSGTSVTVFYGSTCFQLAPTTGTIFQRTTIDAASTLTAKGTFAMASANSTESAGSWVIDVYGTLSVSNVFSLLTGPAPITGALNVKTGGTVNHLGGTMKAATNATSNLPTITVDGTLNLSSSANADFSTNPNLVVTGSGTVEIKSGAKMNIGNAAGISAEGTMSGPIQTTHRIYSTAANYIYSGTSAQVTGNGLPSTVNTLTINNTAGVTLSAITTVTNSLALTSGLLNIGNNSITLGTAATVAGTPGTTAMVVTDGTGNFIKSIADAATLPLTFTFPIGETSGTTQYSPVAVTVTSATLASASISAKVVNTKHASNTSATDYINRYWTLSSAGITGASMNVTGTYLLADVAGTEGNLWTGQYNGSSWSKLNAVNAATHTLSGTGIASLGDFTAGESGAFVSGGFVTITLIPEGYYRSDVDPLPVSDVFTATLASATGPDYADVETANITIDANTYTGTATFTTAPSGDYYLYVKGIALMATWTAAPITFTQGSTVSYDFTDAVTKAYAIPGFPFDPMIQQGTKWTIYSGDVDQDELIGNVDLTMIDNDAFVTLEVHGATDLDGDALVGNVDLTICDNHAFWVVESQTPRKVGGMASKYLHKPVLKRTNSFQK